MGPKELIRSSDKLGLMIPTSTNEYECEYERVIECILWQWFPVKLYFQWNCIRCTIGEKSRPYVFGNFHCNQSSVRHQHSDLIACRTQRIHIRDHAYSLKKKMTLFTCKNDLGWSAERASTKITLKRSSKVMQCNAIIAVNNMVPLHNSASFVSLVMTEISRARSPVDLSRYNCRKLMIAI